MKNRYAPDGANIASKRVIRHRLQEGDALVKAVAALQPGDKLVLVPGMYSVKTNANEPLSRILIRPVNEASPTEANSAKADYPAHSQSRSDFVSAGDADFNRRPRDS